MLNFERGELRCIYADNEYSMDWEGSRVFSLVAVGHLPTFFLSFTSAAPPCVGRLGAAECGMAESRVSRRNQLLCRKYHNVPEAICSVRCRRARLACAAPCRLVIAIPVIRARTPCIQLKRGSSKVKFWGRQDITNKEKNSDGWFFC